MKFVKIITLVTIITPYLLSSNFFDDNFIDNDMDGVSDDVDKCLYTPFLELVDSNGCSINGAINVELSVASLDEKYGDIKYSSFRDLLNIDYIKNSWGFSVSFEYYSDLQYSDPEQTINMSGFGDTRFYLKYTHFVDEASSISYIAMVKVPTAQNDIGTGEFDFGGYISADRYFDKFLLYSTIGYIKSGDRPDVDYQDPKNFSIGIGYELSDDLYSSLAYYRSDIHEFSIYIRYLLKDDFYISGYFSYGGSDTTELSMFTLSLGKEF